MARSLSTQLRAMDFEQLDGHTGSGHLVWKHPRAGTLIVASTPGDRRSDLNALAQARRMLRLMESNVGAFISHLRSTYDVPRDGHKDLRLNLSDEARNWIEREHVKGITVAGIVEGLRNSPFYEALANRRGHKASEFRLYGRDFALEDLAVPSPLLPSPPVSSPPVPSNGHATTELGDLLTGVERLLANYDATERLQLVAQGLRDLLELVEGR